MKPNSLLTIVNRGVKTTKNLITRGLTMFCVLAITSIKAQNTFTVSELQADSATVTIKLEATKVQAQTTEANYTKADSVSAGIVRTDTLCSAKDLCVHQDAKVSGNVEVSGKVIAKSGILMDTNAVGIFKRYQEIPIMDSAQSGMKTRIAFINAGSLSLPGSNTIDVPPIDYDPCEDPSSFGTGGQYSSGFIASAVRSPVVNSAIKMWADWWSGSGMIDVGGTTLPNAGLYLNYWCGRPVYIGWGFGNGTDWRGMAGSKVYIGDFVRMRKHVEIGDPTWGTQGVNNINLESTNHGNVANIRARTWTVKQFCVFNTNDGSSAPTHGYNGRNTFAVYGDGRVWIRSLETYVPMLSIGQYTSTSSSETNGVEKFRIYSDARTEWVASSGTQNMLTVKDASNVAVFRVRGDGKVYIGKEVPLSTGVHHDAMLSIDGKAIAKKFFVTTKPGIWGDYVFEKNYCLMPLKELKEYVFEFKHLPEVPTAAIVEKEGIDIGEINVVLVKKLEEAYLYIFQLESRISELEKFIKQSK